jgi:hypothetical protein
MSINLCNAFIDSSSCLYIKGSLCNNVGNNNNNGLYFCNKHKNTINNLNNTKKHLLKQKLIKYSKSINIDDECSICTYNLNNKKNIVFLECHHVFHIDCIFKWFNSNKNTCPNCRHKSCIYESLFTIDDELYIWLKNLNTILDNKMKNLIREYIENQKMKSLKMNQGLITLLIKNIQKNRKDIFSN